MAHRCYLTHLECSATGERHEAGRSHTLSRAGKPLLARYDLEALGRDVDPEALRRHPPGLWRYLPLLPVSDPAAIVSLGEVETPLIPLATLACSGESGVFTAKAKAANGMEAAAVPLPATFRVPAVGPGAPVFLP